MAMVWGLYDSKRRRRLRSRGCDVLAKKPRMLWGRAIIIRPAWRHFGEAYAQGPYDSKCRGCASQENEDAVEKNRYHQTGFETFWRSLCSRRVIG